MTKKNKERLVFAGCWLATGLLGTLFVIIAGVSLKGVQ